MAIGPPLLDPRDEVGASVELMRGISAYHRGGGKGPGNVGAAS